MQLKGVSAKALACCFQICLYFAVLCQMLPFQSSSSPSVHHLAGLTLDRFPRGDTRCPSSISYYIDVPCPGSLQASIFINHARDVCLFSYPYVCFYVTIYYMFNIILSIFLCASLSLVWLVRVRASTPYVIDVNLYLQAG